MAVHHFKDEQRNDPELRDKVERVLLAQNALLLKASTVLKALSDEMRVLSGTRDSHSIYDRSFSAVNSAYYRVSSDADFMNRDGAPNDCYIGNMAASQMGDYIKSVDFDKRFRGMA